MQGLKTLSLLIALCAIGLATRTSFAQPADWPSKPVRIVVGYPAGGPNDLIARAIGQRLSATLNQPVIVDNRPGASGTIGSEFVSRAEPDGYTLMLNATTHSMVNALYDKLSFDADRDFTTISMVGVSTLVLVVNADVSVRTVKELIALAKASPNKLSFASTGSGSSPHLGGEMFKQMAGVDIAHIPYKGSAPAMADLLGGHVPLMFETLPSAAPHIKSGKLRPLAVTTDKRALALPDVPTMAEAGLPGFEITVWWGVFGPPKMPRVLTEKIAAAVNATLSAPDIQERFAGLGITPAGTNPDEFRRVLQRDIKKYAKVIKDGGIRAN